MLHSNVVWKINITENNALQVRINFFLGSTLFLRLKQQQQQQLFEWAKETIFPN